MSNILRSMKLWQKFAVLGVIGTVMCAVPLTKVIQYKSDEISVAKGEDAGIDPLRTALSLQQQLQKHRALSVMSLAGNANADADRRASQAEINTLFATVTKQVTDLGYTKSIEQVKGMKAAWDKVSQQVDGHQIDSLASFDSHIALVEQNFNLIDQIADASSLSLDPVADTYYLMTALTDHLPRLAESIAHARGQGILMLQAKEVAAVDRAMLTSFAQRAQYLQDRAQAQLGKAMESQAHLKTEVASMTPAGNNAAQFAKLAEKGLAQAEHPAITMDEFRRAGNAAVDAQYKLAGEVTTALEGELHERIHSTEQQRISLLVLLGSLGLVAVGMGIAITRSVTKPLEHAIAAADSVAAGDLGFNINDEGHDEAAMLLTRFSEMQKQLQHRRLEDGQRLAETEAQGLAATQVAEEISAAVDGANQGDFTYRVSLEGKADFHANLCAKFNELIETVSATIREVRTAADQLSASSNQVSQTSQALSHSASQQAASVEETTASLQEMSTSVKQNAESATVTDGIAAKAAKEALEGGTAVSQTVEAMTAIATKIAIIDDIAYQTNLLALNAAIEAARAGEHGKGFAVVAAEVRKLAERSQVAAQEIGALASSSVHLAESAGELLTHMVPSIQKTGELVQEIAAASGEQADGVAQITGAMNHLSSATQQTASASEQLSATAEELSAQASQLQELMGFFRLADDHQQRPGKARSTPAPQAAASQTLKFGQGVGASHTPARPVNRGHKPSAPSDIDESAFAHF
jgi:methyl-accepting chemotaxis protein